MSDTLPDFLADLGDWRPGPEEFPVLEGAADPHRSDDSFLRFAVDPCGGPWIRVPADAVAAMHRTGEVRCGSAVYPRVELELDPDCAASRTAIDGIRAAAAVGTEGGSAAGDSALVGGDDDEVGSHDVRVELRPEGKLYRIRLELEGHRVRSMDWKSERKVYTAEISALSVEDTLDVELRAWGNEGASLTLSVELDGRPLEPPLEARVTDEPVNARRSYRL